MSKQEKKIMWGIQGITSVSLPSPEDVKPSKQTENGGLQSTIYVLNFYDDFCGEHQNFNAFTSAQENFTSVSKVR